MLGKLTFRRYRSSKADWGKFAHLDAHRYASHPAPRSTHIVGIPAILWMRATGSSISCSLHGTTVKPGEGAQRPNLCSQIVFLSSENLPSRVQLDPRPCWRTLFHEDPGRDAGAGALRPAELLRGAGCACLCVCVCGATVFRKTSERTGVPRCTALIWLPNAWLWLFAVALQCLSTVLPRQEGLVDADCARV